MSYHIYSSECIVLKKKSTGEGDDLFYLFTEDFGLILARSVATRSYKSKLKNALVEYSLVNLSCIKGKNGWKITNTESIKNYYFNLDEYQQIVLARVSSFILKIIAGELPHTELFKVVKNGFDNLKNVPKDALNDLELLLVLRILKELGYIPNLEITSSLFSSNDWHPEVLYKLRNNRKEILSVVNSAIKHSHL